MAVLKAKALPAPYAFVYLTKMNYKDPYYCCKRSTTVSSFHNRGGRTTSDAQLFRVRTGSGASSEAWLGAGAAPVGEGPGCRASSPLSTSLPRSERGRTTRPAARCQPRSSRLKPGPHSGAARAPALSAVVASRPCRGRRRGLRRALGLSEPPLPRLGSGGDGCPAHRLRVWPGAWKAQAQCPGSRPPWWSRVAVIVVTMTQDAGTQGALWGSKLWVRVSPGGRFKYVPLSACVRAE